MATTTTLVFDIETNGLEPDTIWCIGISDYESGITELFKGDDVPLAIMILSEADLLVGHNILGYDVPVIEKLSGVSLRDIPMVDTLELSRQLHPTRLKHSLESWGRTLGFPKGHHVDWHEPSEAMFTYCVRDVELTTRLFETLVGV
ncbi:ribonuclease H-like domain-containing protein [Escherichia coli]|uniref:ribonuclease H-like domain-containing protein n=1 Tax=Escherichia coli TaxID=562 RepID=UPI000E213F5B|nr:ribonuclease H-like domain-containing protein [Escherichia coli]